MRSSLRFLRCCTALPEYTYVWSLVLLRQVMTAKEPMKVFGFAHGVPYPFCIFWCYVGVAIASKFPKPFNFVRASWPQDVVMQATSPAGGGCDSFRNDHNPFRNDDCGSCASVGLTGIISRRNRTEQNAVVWILFVQAMHLAAQIYVAAIFITHSFADCG